MNGIERKMMVLNKLKLLLHKFRLLYAYFCYIGKAKFRKKTCIHLLSTPWHGNLGDQAIILAEYQALQKVFPEYEIFECPTEVLQVKRLRGLVSAVQSNDIIALPGGGNLGSLYPMEEEIHRYIMTEYKENKILFMPQSIFFGEDMVGKTELAKSKEAYSAAKNLALLARDEVSYAKAKTYFPENKIYLAPDTVTVLEEYVSKNLPSVKRDGVCFFLRKDKEKVLDDTMIHDLCDWLKSEGIPYTISDTVVPDSMRKNEKRWQYVKEKLELAKKSCLVITDRYHGTIFSVITHTPVIAFKSFDSKIVAGLKWFQSLDWVHSGDKLDMEAIRTIIQKYRKESTAEQVYDKEISNRLIQTLRTIREGWQR